MGGGPAAVAAAVRPLPPQSPSIRLIGLLKQQPESDLDLDFEFNESDVFWSPPSPPPDHSSNSPITAADDASDDDGELDPPFSDTSSLNSARSNASRSSVSRPYAPRKSGLTAALADEESHPVQWRPAARKEEELLGRSLPMNVPAWPRRRPPRGREVPPSAAEEDEGMVPPHVLVARSHVTSFSVFEGVGRTLKGRDLRRVRNAVMQQTGFID